MAESSQADPDNMNTLHFQIFDLFFASLFKNIVGGQLQFIKKY